MRILGFLQFSHGFFDFIWFPIVFIWFPDAGLMCCYGFLWLFMVSYMLFYDCPLILSSVRMISPLVSYDLLCFAIGLICLPMCSDCFYWFSFGFTRKTSLDQIVILRRGISWCGPLCHICLSVPHDLVFDPYDLIGRCVARSGGSYLGWVCSPAFCFESDFLEHVGVDSYIYIYIYIYIYTYLFICICLYVYCIFKYFILLYK